MPFAGRRSIPAFAALAGPRVRQGAASEAWCFLQESSCRVRSSQPFVLSVAAVKEVQAHRTTRLKRIQGIT